MHYLENWRCSKQYVDDIFLLVSAGYKHSIAVEFCSLGLNLDVQSSHSRLVKLQFPLQHERQDRWTPPNFLFAPFSLPEDM